MKQHYSGWFHELAPREIVIFDGLVCIVAINVENIDCSIPSPGDNIEVPRNDGYIFNAELLACL